MQLSKACVSVFDPKLWNAARLLLHGERYEKEWRKKHRRFGTRTRYRGRIWILRRSKSSGFWQLQAGPSDKRGLYYIGSASLLQLKFGAARRNCSGNRYLYHAWILSPLPLGGKKAAHKGGRAHSRVCDGNQGAEPLAKKTGVKLKSAGWFRIFLCYNSPKLLLWRFYGCM